MSLASLAALIGLPASPSPTDLGLLVRPPQTTTTCTTQAATSERDTAAVGLQFIPRGKRCHFPPFPSFYFSFVFAVRAFGGPGTRPLGLLNSAPLSFRDCFGKFSCLFSVACLGTLRLGMVFQQGSATRFCLFRPEGFREAKKCAILL